MHTKSLLPVQWIQVQTGQTQSVVTVRQTSSEKTFISVIVGPTIQPGVGPEVGGVEAAAGVHHSYYQWVGMALFVLSMTFYVPHFIWKTCEGKRVERLVSGNMT